MRTLALIALLGSAVAGVTAIGAAPASAQISSDRVIDVYGDEKCPASNGQQIVVCRRHQLDEKFRIPKDLRDATPEPQALGSSGVAAVNTTGGTGLPYKSCNAVGAGVNDGCMKNELDAWKAQQRAQKAAEKGVP